MSLTPFNPSRQTIGQRIGGALDHIGGRPTALDRQVDAAKQHAAAEDEVIRYRTGLEAKRADDGAFDRGFYVRNRMEEAATFANRIVSEPDETVRSAMAPWFNLHQGMEQVIYRNTFGQ